MKSTTAPIQSISHPGFPYLAYSTASGSVFLALSPDRGICLHPGQGTISRVGQEVSGPAYWDASVWRPYLGAITLSNV